MKRALFVLTSPEAGEQFLRVLPDLRGIGLSDATILHLLSAEPGPAEPMPDLANWVRHFEAAIANVELALKRGDPVKWIYDLARVRHSDLVVISAHTGEEDWDLERVSSPLRSLGVPILFIPDHPVKGTIGERVLIAVKGLDSFDRIVNQLSDWFEPSRLHGVRVADCADTDGPECNGVQLVTIADKGDVATTLLEYLRHSKASLLTITAGAETTDPVLPPTGIPVVSPILQDSERPVLIWP
jgi:hypothetical protein